MLRTITAGPVENTGNRCQAESSVPSTLHILVILTHRSWRIYVAT